MKRKADDADDLSKSTLTDSEKQKDGNKELKIALPEPLNEIIYHGLVSNEINKATAENQNFLSNPLMEIKKEGIQEPGEEKKLVKTFSTASNLTSNRSSEDLQLCTAILHTIIAEGDREGLNNLYNEAKAKEINLELLFSHVYEGGNTPLSLAIKNNTAE